MNSIDPVTYIIVVSLWMALAVAAAAVPARRAISDPMKALRFE